MFWTCRRLASQFPSLAARRLAKRSPAATTKLQSVKQEEGKRSIHRRKTIHPTFEEGKHRTKARVEEPEEGSGQVQLPAGKTSVHRKRILHPAFEDVIVKRQEALNPGEAAAIVHSGKLTFLKLPLHKAVVGGLEDLGAVSPTHIQVKAIPRIVRGENLIIAAETGSGKTLCYLAPIISHYYRDYIDKNIVPKLCQPVCVILVPSKELVRQIMSVCHMLSRGVRFFSFGVFNTMPRRVIAKRLESSPRQVCVATPQSFLTALNEHPISLAKLQTVVVDEADTMVDRYFHDNIKTLVDLLKKTEWKTGKDIQMLFTGATLPDEAIQRIKELVPSVLEIKTDGVHKLLPNVEFSFLKLRQEQKSGRLLELVKRDRDQLGQTIVFCNTVRSCDWACAMLSKNKQPVVKLHSGIDVKERHLRFKSFSEGEVKTLVTTDLTARGLDTQKVGHIIMFDFPDSTVDFLHRSGRVGRVGAELKGRCTSFVVHRRDQRLVHVIKECAARNKALPKIEMW